MNRCLLRNVVFIVSLMSLCVYGQGYPDPNRFEADIQRFEAADQQQFPPQNAIVCVGSSSLRGWHQTLVLYVDIATGMLDHQGLPRQDIFQSDHLHMTRAGYMIWRDCLRPPLLAKETERGNIFDLDPVPGDLRNDGNAVAVADSQSLAVGEYVLQTEALRLRYLHVRLPLGEVLEYTGKGDPEGSGWTLRFAASAPDRTQWHLQLEQSSTAVRRQVDYWFFVPCAGAEMGPMEPLFASETAYDVETGGCIFRAQTMDWCSRYRATDYTVALARAAPWVLQHLDVVYDLDILTLCADHFWHSPSNEEGEGGYRDVIACTQRCIELDPQAIDLYTNNAWLLWSDWVSSLKDPNRILQDQDNVEKAVRLIQKGRAANPHNAAFYLDAANTLAPLARHHRPELMGMVIRYYHHAENLATDKAMRIEARKILGHRYRIQGHTEEAILWYRATLELDPENKVALRFLKELTSDDSTADVNNETP